MKELQRLIQNAQEFSAALAAIGKARSVGKIKNILLGQSTLKRCYGCVAAYARIENGDRLLQCGKIGHRNSNAMFAESRRKIGDSDLIY
ncbi:MAG: hypothetical protein ABS35_03445 [Kaistia sp. SCN 65-12]|nr:MAG: hypothetical protein ABS35_03445 [Kaistia sp. SCN 65-12]